MADGIEAILAGLAGGLSKTAQIKRENELLQLQAKREEQQARTKRIESQTGFLMEFARSNPEVFTPESLIGAIQMVQQGQGLESFGTLEKRPEQPPTKRELLEIEKERFEEEKPQRQAELELTQRRAGLIGAQEALTREELRQMGLAKPAESEFALTKEGTDLLFKFQERVLKVPGFKEFSTIVDNLAAINSAVLRAQKGEDVNRIATDQVVITAFNKILDPGSVVRESEFARTPQGAALVRRAEASLQRLRRGGILTLADIQEIRNTAVEMAEAKRKIINKKLAPIRKSAQKRRLDPDEVITLFPSVESVLGGSQVPIQQQNVPSVSSDDIDNFIKSQNL